MAAAVSAMYYTKGTITNLSEDSSPVKVISWQRTMNFIIYKIFSAIFYAGLRGFKGAGNNKEKFNI